MNKRKSDHPHIEIIEQPCSKSRFRYPCEARNTGNVVGASSNGNRRTWPTIKIHGLKGRIAVIMVSCVTQDPPHYPHPHSVVGRDKADLGFYTFESVESLVTFPNLGIQCVKKKNIKEALEKRESCGVDPFNTGFDHKNNGPDVIDLTAVRLCFQVFLKKSKEEKPSIKLPPVVSKPVFDKKILNDLAIVKLSHCSAPVTGGTPMILLCEKIAKDNVCIVFFELQNGKSVWEARANFGYNDVYRQVSIAFESPAYHDLNIEEPVHVYIQLRKLSDESKSEPLPFTFTPVGAESNITLKRKRQKYNTSGLIDMDLEEPKPRHCPRCSCFDTKSTLTETRKIANKLLAFRPQTIEEKPSTVVRQQLIDVNGQNDAPLDLHLRKNLMNGNNRSHQEKVQSYQEQLKLLDQQIVQKSQQSQQLQQQQLNQQLINQVQNLHQQQLNHVQNQYQQQQNLLQNQQHNYVQNRQQQNQVQVQRINQQLNHVGNQQHRLQQQMLSPQQQLQQQMREKMLQQQKLQQAAELLEQQQQYQQMLPIQALQQLQAYPIMNQQQQQQRKQLNQFAFYNQQPQLQNNYNLQQFQQQLRPELPINRQIEQLVELQSMQSSSQLDQPRQLMQYYQQPQQLYQKQQEQQQQQYSMGKNERLNAPQLPLMLNGCQNDKICDYNNQQQQDLSLMEQSCSQQMYRSTSNDDYSDEDEDQGKQHQADDANDDEFNSDGSPYVNNNGPQVIQNRPPSLFTIRNTLKPQQQHNIAKYVDGNVNAFDKVNYQNNEDLDRIQVRKISETLGSSLSLLDTELNSPPYDARVNNNNNPALEDLLPF